MGISLSSACFLIGEMRRGVDFSKTLTLGRQGVYMQRSQYKRVCSFLHVQAPRQATFADEFFAGLGAKSIDVLDASSYEGAGLTHDLNQPLPATPSKKWSCVIDGGTLEHVFNFPEAIKTCMELVERGGHLILTTPWNNWAGHGFYQFSPELFYRLLSADNGFLLERMLIHQDGKWFSIKDPDSLGMRVEECGSAPTLLYISAKKLKTVPIFSQWPQQSDYSKAWSTVSPPSVQLAATGESIKNRLWENFPVLENMQTKWRKRKEGRIQKHRKTVWTQAVPSKNGIPI
jgi:hypothetical protein